MVTGRTMIVIPTLLKKKIPCVQNIVQKSNCNLVTNFSDRNARSPDRRTNSEDFVNVTTRTLRGRQRTNVGFREHANSKENP